MTLSQQVLLERLPPFLYLCLEQFLYNSITGDTVTDTTKISKPVQFEPEFKIPPGNDKFPFPLC